MSFTPSFLLSAAVVDPDICIGNSLSTINNNFELLDYKLSNIALSAEQFWNSVYTLAAEASANWDDVATIVRTHSALWDSAYTTVASYSACWLRPITLMFPNTPDLYTVNAGVLLASVTSWLNANFPIVSTVDDEEVTNFCPGQEIYVFVLGYSPVTEIIAPDASLVTAYCEGSFSWSYTSCAIRGRCYSVADSGYAIDTNTWGNPNDDGGVGTSIGDTSISLLASISNLETLNRSIINYVPSIYGDYLKFKNTNGSTWSYIGAVSLQ